VTKGIPEESLTLCQERPPNATLLVGVAVRVDERGYMRVHLTHDEGVDVEQLTHAAHGEVTGNTTVHKFEIMLLPLALEGTRIVRDDLSRLSSNHELNRIESQRDGATGQDS